MATPKLSYHRAKSLYFARFDGKQVYFGKDHAEAAQRFAEALTLWPIFYSLARLIGIKPNVCRGLKAGNRRGVVPNIYYM